jgi:hypothetical protein
MLAVLGLAMFPLGGLVGVVPGLAAGDDLKRGDMGRTPVGHLLADQQGGRALEGHQQLRDARAGRQPCVVRLDAGDQLGRLAAQRELARPGQDGAATLAGRVGSQVCLQVLVAHRGEYAAVNAVRTNRF